MTENDLKEVEAEGNGAGNFTHPARNPVEHVTGKVETIFGGGNSWGN